MPNFYPPLTIGLLMGSLFVQPICAEEHSAPSLGEMQREVERHFANLPDYQPGDIITVQNAEPLLAKLVEVGWVT